MIDDHRPQPYGGSFTRGPHRLEAQDTGFSVRGPGFESPWGYLRRVLTPGRSLGTGQAFFCARRVTAFTRIGPSNYSGASRRPSGETGRRTGLKIPGG